ncbi:MAG: glycosyltransferase [Candidatus Moranbacteria bacterium]|nr:glycosyltransferase [Candidatus Moranbacteria bacterium]
MKKILILNPEFPPIGGGASSVSYELAKKISKKSDFQMDVVTMGYGKLAKFEKLNNKIQIFRLNCFRKKQSDSRFIEQFIFLILGLLKSFQLIRKNRYVFCHCHFFLPTGIIALTNKKILNLDYVISAHGSDVPGYNNERFKLIHKFSKFFLRQIAKNSRKIIAPSVYLADLIKKNIGYYKNIVVIANGLIDIAKDKIKKQNIILTSSRLVKRKGVQYLIEAFKKIPNKKDWRLFIVGDGHYQEKLISIASKEESIFFLGWLDRNKAEYKEIFNKSKIFVFLSQRESQGMVLLEAMSASCALISVKNSALKEIIDEKNSILVKRKAIDQIKNALEKLINNKDLLKKMQKRARKRYEQNFQWENIAFKYLKIYKDLNNDD